MLIDVSDKIKIPIEIEQKILSRMGVFPSGQWGQTVSVAGGSNPPAPTQESSTYESALNFCFAQFSVGHSG